MQCLVHVYVVFFLFVNVSVVVYGCLCAFVVVCCCVVGELRREPLFYRKLGSLVSRRFHYLQTTPPRV